MQPDSLLKFKRPTWHSEGVKPDCPGRVSEKRELQPFAEGSPLIVVYWSSHVRSHQRLGSHKAVSPTTSPLHMEVGMVYVLNQEE